MKPDRRRTSRLLAALLAAPLASCVAPGPRPEPVAQGPSERADTPTPAPAEAVPPTAEAIPREPIRAVSGEAPAPADDPGATPDGLPAGDEAPDDPAANDLGDPEDEAGAPDRLAQAPDRTRPVPTPPSRPAPRAAPNPAQRTAPAPATPTPPPTPAPSAPAAPAAGSFEEAFGQVAGGPAAGQTSGGGTVLETIGDQGVISLGPLPGKGPPVSIMRNFALNVTDNNSAGLQDRIIPLEYYHFFDANRVYPGLPLRLNRPVAQVATSGRSGAGTLDNFAAQIGPSRLSGTRLQTDDNRYVFGFEKILRPNLSVLVRQAVVTISQPDLTLQNGIALHRLGGTHSGWGDLQIVPKYRLYQDRTLTVTTGMGMVIPIGQNNAYGQFGNSAFVFQPNLLFLAAPTERLVTQGGLEYDVPLADNLAHVSLFRWVLFGAYRIYDNPDPRSINAIYPLVELHGEHLVGGFTQNTLNTTVGFRINAFRRYQLGIGYAFPLTTQRQFSNEILANLNIFF